MSEGQDERQAAFDEEAARLEYDEVMPRRKAEALARKFLAERGFDFLGVVTSR